MKGALAKANPARPAPRPASAFPALAYACLQPLPQRRTANYDRLRWITVDYAKKKNSMNRNGKTARFPNPKSPIRNPQSEIRNPKSNDPL
jgi:hypothetical protein